MRKLIIKLARKIRLQFSRLHTWIWRSSFSSIGQGVRIDFPCRIEQPHLITVGDGCIFYPTAWLNPVVAWGDRQYNGRITLGNRVMVGYKTQISAAGSITIEDDVTVAAGVVIVDHTHDHRFPGVSIFEAPLSEPRPVHIGKRTFLGVNCFIGPGVQIGEQAVISANAVVTKDVPAYCIATGNPARFIRYHNPSETEEPTQPVVVGE